MSKNTVTIEDAYRALADILPHILLGNGLSYILPRIKGEFLVIDSGKPISVEVLSRLRTIAKDYQGGGLKIDAVDRELSGLCDSLVSRYQFGELTFADYNFTQTILALNERQVWLGLSIKDVLKEDPGESSNSKGALERIQEYTTDDGFRSLREGESENPQTDLSRMIYDLGEWSRTIFYETMGLEKQFNGGDTGKFTAYVQSKILDVASNKYPSNEYHELEKRLGDSVDKFSLDSRVEKRFYSDYQENISPFFLLDYFVSLVKEGKSN